MKIRERSPESLQKALFWFLIAQPYLDVLSYWANVYEITLFTTLFRAALLAVFCLWGFAVSGKKRAYAVFFAVSALCYGGHLIGFLLSGCRDLTSDLSNFVRILHMPAMVLVFLTAFQNREELLEKIGKAFFYNLLSTVGLLLVSLLIGPRNYTYDYHEIGLMGWAAVDNCQSAVVTLNVPFSLYYGYKKDKKLFVLCAFLGFAQLFLMATRLAYFSIFLIAAGVVFALLMGREKRLFYYLVIACVVAVSLGAYSLSPRYAYRQSHEKVAAEREAWVESVFEGVEKSDDYSAMSLEQKEAYDTVYTYYLGGFVGKYGLEYALEQYDYTLNPELLCNNRAKKLRFCDRSFDESGALAHLFGMGYENMVFDGEVFDPENDVNAMVYSVGYVGMGLYGLFCLYFALRVLKSLLKHFGRTLTEETVITLLTLCLLLGAAQFSGNVLRRPNVSVFLSLMLAACYRLTEEQ